MSHYAAKGGGEGGTGEKGRGWGRWSILISFFSYSPAFDSSNGPFSDGKLQISALCQVHFSS